MWYSGQGIDIGPSNRIVYESSSRLLRQDKQSLEFCYLPDSVAMSRLQNLDITGRRRRRGVVKSITKLIDCIRELEGKVELTHTDWLAAKRLQQQLTNMDGEFRTYMYYRSVIDWLEDEGELENNQALLDNHDDRVTGLFSCLML